ncbi:hypothetical protein SALBM311S_07129 [Streptomyces alboniger]
MAAPRARGPAAPGTDASGARPPEYTQDGNHWQESGVDTQLLRLGQDPVALFTATAASGPLGRYVARYGPGLHSVAWTIDDLWAAETLLRRRNVRITGADVPGGIYASGGHIGAVGRVDGQRVRRRLTRRRADGLMAGRDSSTYGVSPG